MLTGLKKGMLSTSVFKICIFGDGGVGKSTLIKNYVSGEFIQDTKITIGVDIKSKDLVINNYNVILQIWDFGGEDRFRFLLPSFCIGASGGIFMYDITRFNTLFSLEEWINLFNKNAFFNGSPIPVFIVGGKADLENQRAVTIQDVSNFVKDKAIAGIYECSSKLGQNIENIFKELTLDIMRNVGLIQ